MVQDRAALEKSARKHLAAGRVQQAIDDYLKILRNEPGDQTLLALVGDLYLKLGQSALAIPLFQRIAEQHSAEGFLHKAVAIYRRIQRLDPDRADLRLQLAEACFRQGLLPDARSELLALVDFYERRGLHREMIRIFQRLTEYFPDSLEIRVRLAGVYEKTHQASEAVGQYLEISNHWIRERKIPEALAVLESARKLSPRNAAVLWKILWICLQENEFVRAGELLEEFMSSNEDDPEMLGLIVKSFLQPDQAEKMMELIDRAPESSVRPESLRILKGELHLKKGDVESAYIQFVQAIEEMLPRGRQTQAIALMRRLTRHDATYHPAWELLVDLYIQQGQESNLPLAYSALADAYIARSLYAEARKCLERLLESEPRNRKHRDRLEFVLTCLEKQEPVRDEEATADFDLEVSLTGPYDSSPIVPTQTAEQENQAPVDLDPRYDSNDPLP